MYRSVSPAAAAAISRLLKRAGIQRATELQKGIEFEGYWAEPRGDHVRVDYSPAFWVEPDEARPIVEAGLARCKTALLCAHYDVQDREAEIVYGGNTPMTLPVLEVRRAEWTQR